MVKCTCRSCVSQVPDVEDGLRLVDQPSRYSGECHEYQEVNSDRRLVNECLGKREGLREGQEEVIPCTHRCVFVLTSLEWDMLTVRL